MRLTPEELQALLGKPGYHVVGDTPSRSPQAPSALQDDSQGGSMPDDTPEGLLLARVRRCALDNGFLFYHTYSSRRSDPGYLDCTLTKPGHPLYIWELKTRTGKLTREQETWIAFLRQATCIEAACYRPAELPLMQALLTRRTPHG